MYMYDSIRVPTHFGGSDAEEYVKTQAGTFAATHNAGILGKKLQYVTFRPQSHPRNL